MKSRQWRKRVPRVHPVWLPHRVGTLLKVLCPCINKYYRYPMPRQEEKRDFPQKRFFSICLDHPWNPAMGSANLQQPVHWVFSFPVEVAEVAWQMHLICFSIPCNLTRDPFKGKNRSWGRWLNRFLGVWWSLLWYEIWQRPVFHHKFS